MGEVYALEIQMYTAQKNNKKLKALYDQSLHIKSAIPHPLILGVIRECGGKMHLREGEYEKAHTDFFEAFKNYDESGSPRRTICLKYLVLANMLMKSGINPFDSQEAKPYIGFPILVFRFWFSEFSFPISVFRFWFSEFSFPISVFQF